MRVQGRLKIDTPLPRQAALISGVGEYTGGGVEVTPTVVAVEKQSHVVEFDVLNPVCYTGIQGLNYPELPSRGILGNKEIILFDCMCELCGYEWVWLLDELMSVCSVSDNFYTFF